MRGEVVPLTATEYKLLYHLVRNAGHVLRHETLLAKVWGREYVDEVDYLRVYIRRLRRKLEDDPERPRHILTERGLGYRFRATCIAGLFIFCLCPLGRSFRFIPYRRGQSRSPGHGKMLATTDCDDAQAPTGRGHMVVGRRR